MLGASLQLPMRTVLGLLPPAWLERHIALSKAGSAGAALELHPLTVQKVASLNRDLPENDYVPFTIAKRAANGSFKATQQDHVHYADVDTGA